MTRQASEGSLEKATFEMSPWLLQKTWKTSTCWTAGSLCPKFEAQGSDVATASEIRVLA